MIPELEDFNPADVSDDYDFWQTPSGELVLATRAAFASLFAVPTVWLKDEYIDHRTLTDHPEGYIPSRPDVTGVQVNSETGKVEIAE